jgi:taurine dioxygenase
MNLEIIPTGAALAAEVRGLDLSEPMDDRTFAMVEHAYDEHGVLFFRDQRITPEQQVAFTCRFVVSAIGEALALTTSSLVYAMSLSASA